MNTDTLVQLVDRWVDTCPDKTWLRDCRDQGTEDYSWRRAQTEISAIGAMLEQRFGQSENMVVLSRNRAHWVMADLATIASGNVTVSMFTTLPRRTADYICGLTQPKAVFVGETGNWDQVAPILPEDVLLVTLPGVDLDLPHERWEDILTQFAGSKPLYRCAPDDVISLVFTSGTTGDPKGVIQTHNSSLIPVRRALGAFGLPDQPRYFSYLPLSHIGERQQVEFSSIVLGGEIYFNESMNSLYRDLQRASPHLFFGPPRVWELLQQAVMEKFGGQEPFAEAMLNDSAGTGNEVLEWLGLNGVRYCLSAAASAPASLMQWWQGLGLTLMEGFGQTEAMSTILSNQAIRRTGSVGKPAEGVQCRIAENGELVLKADGCTPGYYRQEQATAELFRDGWLHTGDMARVDEDGFIFITGRVKEYFKTIHGKYVAPSPIENSFARNYLVGQQCLLGRGYSKTVMVLVLTGEAQGLSKERVESSLAATLAEINETVEKHARIGAVIISRNPWTIENEMLTPTLKIRRERIEEQFGSVAEQLGRKAAEGQSLILHWEQM